ncbi:MAG: calcium/sodium antiporter [Bacteroidales bacterium]|nr:calcium/sodium antiporter [Bacteroidales bacterium]
MTYLMLFTGLALLLISGEFLVRGSVALAAHFKLSKLVIALTVVSFGTSAPELVVSVDAALSGHPAISAGNVVGSNISNIGLVLALAIIITPFYVNTRSVMRDWITMMVLSLLLLIMLSDLQLSRIEGIILLVLLVSFIYFTLSVSRKTIPDGKTGPPVVKIKLPAAIIMVVLSCGGLVAGADLLVKGATDIARMMGLSERIISVSVIALGTSLPELATSAVAAVRKENDISIGNILGSNIFNILAILGITSLISPFSLDDPGFFFDLAWMCGISLILFILMLPLRGTVLRRWKGLLLAVLYLTYIYIVFFVK